MSGKVDAGPGTAYHRRSATRLRSTELRPSHLSLLPFVLAVLLAACATPGPPPVEPSPKVATPAPAPAPPVAEVARPPAPPVSEMSSAVAELEPLPPPAEDLWARVRRGFAMPDLDDALVAKWEQWYVSRPDYVARMIDRSRRYLYYIVVEVEQRHMPLEIALLPMVESAFNPNAISVSRASGIWQFMPATGTHYGLKQNFWFDSRRDVVAATESALTYLQKLHGDFGDWQLALAGYNWGEGNVARAITRNQQSGLPTDYAGLRMPDETRNYLPKLQALKNIVRDPEKYGVQLSDIPDAPYFAVVKMARKIDVKVAAQLAEMPVDEFLYLNPQHNRPVIAGADEYALLLPIDKAELFAAKLQLTNQPLVSWQAYRTRNGETLQQIAAKFGLEVEGLRAVNGIGAKAKVPVGHTLLVPMQGPADAAADTLSQAVFTTVPQGRTFYYRVKHGETLAGIATRYSVSSADLRRWNGLTKDSVVAGQALRITSDFAPSAGKAKQGAGNTSKRAAKTVPKRTAGTIPTHSTDTSSRAMGSAKPKVATKTSGKTTAKPAPAKKDVPVAKKAGAAAGG